MAAPVDVDSYLAGFPPEQREILERVRQVIRSQVPDPVEKIRYGMPAIMLGDGTRSTSPGGRSTSGSTRFRPLTKSSNSGLRPTEAARIR